MSFAWYPSPARAEIDTFLVGLSREFAVPMVDTHAWMADEAFSDGHHLLADGAAAFSDRFAPVVARMLAPAPVSKH